ncbi:25263_t:CDS:2 [Gigaspora rosea]|nr:25263_t:CDS:2 [Gigaspora rosea]
MLLRKSKRIKKFDISVIKDASTFPSITSSLFSSLELRECIFSFVVLNGQSTNVDNYINTISKRTKRIQSEGQNSFKNLQKLELEDNDIELHKFLLKVNSKTLKFFIINEKELNNEVKEELVFLLSLNYPNITTLRYVTDNLMFSFTLKKFQKLRQLQRGRLAYVAPYITYDTPYIDPQHSNHDYLLTLNKFLPDSLKILNLLNIFDYSYINLNCFLQNFDVERVKLEVLILPFNIDLDFLPNLRTFIEKARFLRYLEIIRSENFNVGNQKASEREIINLCQIKNIKL